MVIKQVKERSNELHKEFEKAWAVCDIKAMDEVWNEATELSWKTKDETILNALQDLRNVIAFTIEALKKQKEAK